MQQEKVRRRDVFVASNFPPSAVAFKASEPE